jgi:hypothetical protein
VSEGVDENVASFYVNALRTSISTERLESYRLQNGDDLSMITTYLYNIALCEALYSSLNFLEISLRNTLHYQIGNYYGSPAWYLLPGALETEQQRDLSKVTKRIVSRGKAATPGRVVSELNFGFWVSLLSSGYETRLWRPNRASALKASFPNIPKPMRQRTTIYKRYNELREFRNRVFHYEPIWNRPTLIQDYHDILEAISWISLETVALAEVLDRFPDLLAGGRSDIELALKNLANTKGSDAI